MHFNFPRIMCHTILLPYLRIEIITSCMIQGLYNYLPTGETMNMIVSPREQDVASKLQLSRYLTLAWITRL